MHLSIFAIHGLVRESVLHGKVVDVDEYCRRFPELTRKEIQDAVIEVLSMCGGGASWGPGQEHGAPGFRPAVD